jgi:phosphoglycerate dehydrogenase-like enzyme
VSVRRPSGEFATSLLVTIPDASLRGLLGQLPDGVELLEWDMRSPAPRRSIDIVVAPYVGTSEVLGQLDGVAVRLIQSLSIGYDGVADVLPSGHVFANGAGVHETSTAELALALILASQRGLPGFVRDAQEGRWATRISPSLADRAVLLVGYGGVGRAIEERLGPFEVSITRVARTARFDERGEVFGVESLPDLLPLAEIVVVAVPLTDDTTGLVDDAFLSRMADAALLVNVARGKVADTQALIAHAGSGRLRLALDVTDPEPLPSGHPLFSMSNVLVTPHVGGASNAMFPRVRRLLLEQIDRLMNGREPLNVVLRS